jgi:hypothetical protein
MRTFCAVNDQVNEDFLVTRALVDQLHQQYNCRMLSSTDVKSEYLLLDSNIINRKFAPDITECTLGPLVRRYVLRS